MGAKALANDMMELGLEHAGKGTSSGNSVAFEGPRGSSINVLHARWSAMKL